MTGAERGTSPLWERPDTGPAEGAARSAARSPAAEDRSSGTVPGAVLDLVDEAVVMCDASGAVRGYNRRAALFFPLLRLGEALTPASAGPLAEATAEGARAFEASFRDRALVGHRHRWEEREVWLVRDESGTRECQEALRSEQARSEFLAETTRRLGASLHHGRTVRTLVRVALPVLADTALVVMPIRGRRTFWCRGEAGGAVTEGHLPTATLDRVPRVAGVLAGLDQRVVPFPRSELTAVEEAVPGVAEPGGDALVVALRGNGVPAGALVLVRAPGRPRFGEQDVDLARQFAARAGDALATADLYTQQAQIAAVLQSSLWPEPLPAVRGVRLGAAYRPARESMHVSGDFYHVASRAGGAVDFAFGDVCGKGAEAAVLTGKVRQSLRTLALVETRPAQTLHLLNQALLDGDTTQFTTLVTGHARPAPGGGVDVRLAGGGHLPPLVLRRGAAVEQIEIGGTLVGILPEPHFGEAAAHLAPGEVLVLYSDGVTEARGGPTGHELFGEERLIRDVVAAAGMPAGALAERIELLTTEWLGGRPHDDIAVLAVQAPPEPRGAEHAG